MEGLILSQLKMGNKQIPATQVMVTPAANLEIPSKLLHMSLGHCRKPEHLERMHTAAGRT